MRDLSPRVVRYADQPSRTWRDGGGTTRELVVADDPTGPNGGFQWRSSIAEVRQGAAFSVFPGVDRVLVLCQGTSMEVAVDGRAHRLQQFETLGVSR